MNVVDIEGKVANSKLRYLFKRFETFVAPREIDWTKTGRKIVRDRDLYERKKHGFTVEDYVANLYEN